MYKLTDVKKDYPKGRQTVHALQGVDLEIADGEWMAIQGPTGHGKSTLLQILGGLDRATSGSVLLDGTDLTRLGEGSMTKTRATSGFSAEVIHSARSRRLARRSCTFSA